MVGFQIGSAGRRSPADHVDDCRIRFRSPSDGSSNRACIVLSIRGGVAVLSGSATGVPD